ncbi:MAG: 16S rRNA methyltransferase [Spirochaetaceae bacterium]|nr:16S rRNA methyltransferase [Spirochaetaceae bacterium]
MPGTAEFDAFYAKLYGSRWESLRCAMLEPNYAVGLRLKATDHGDRVQLEIVDPPEEGLYRIDRASLSAAQALVLPDQGMVLDACAAPGGKTLVLAASGSQHLRIDANELSVDRRRRLREVLDRHLPEGVRKRVIVSGYDAATLCKKRPSYYDAILLDAPCSSERHVLQDAHVLEQWTPARTRNLAFRQWALLSSAFLMLKPGGCLVYATCSISELENDGVLERLCKKYDGHFRLDPPSWGEPTRHGVIMLPDREHGAGPLYVARLFKAEEQSFQGA